MLASLPARAQADPFCTHTKMVIVAHQDDDLIFQNPALLEAIAAGDCVRTVFVTVGNAGLGEAYWREREEGSRAAYALTPARRQGRNSKAGAAPVPGPGPAK
jgi:LmbE family N-acetylglucosaminyl deacetylase